VRFRAPHIARSREFDSVAQAPAQIVGAQAGLVAVSDGIGAVHEVRDTGSDAMGFESSPTCLTDRFLGRAFAPERAVLEPSWDPPGWR
jgi:hypothetical protein